MPKIHLNRMVVVLQRFVLGLDHSKLQNIDEKDITSNFLTFWKFVVRVVICSKLEAGPELQEKTIFLNQRLIEWTANI